MGIATAQNEGIQQTKYLGCDYVIFFDQDSKISEVEYNLPKNIGIAVAHNIGVRYFIDLGYDYVLFSDKDLIASEKVVDKLLKNY